MYSGTFFGSRRRDDDGDGMNVGGKRANGSDSERWRTAVSAQNSGEYST
jgi:hypothetical protein